MTTLVKQPTAALTRKQFWTMIGGGIPTLTFGILDTVFGYKFDPAVVGPTVLMCGQIAGYLVQERA